MKRTVVAITFCILSAIGNSFAQGRNSERVEYLVNIIDSLDRVILQRDARLDRMDSLLEAEKATSASLREEVISMDNLRKKLETNVSDFQGQNLKLNQSNRILIIFNSFVAVLLIVTLVFYLRKMNRKPANEVIVTGKTVANHSAAVHASFEDKLQQLERLGKLREKGFLSDDEFLVEKNQILGK